MWVMTAFSRYLTMPTCNLHYERKKRTRTGMQRYIAAACTGRAPGVSICEGLVANQCGALCGAHALQAPAEGCLLANPACKNSAASQATGPVACQQDYRQSYSPRHAQGAEHITRVLFSYSKFCLLALLIGQRNKLELSSDAAASIFAQPSGVSGHNPMPNCTRREEARCAAQSMAMQPWITVC